MVTYYWPRLRSVQGQKVWLKLWSSGFFYLTLEVLLHTTYTVSFQISTQYYSTVTTLATALRFSLFLLFVYQIRHASKVTTTFGASSTGSSNKSSNNTSKYAEDNLPSYNSQSKPRPQQESYHLNHVGPSMPLIALDTSQPVRGPISPPSQQRNQNYLPYQQVPEPTAASPMTVGGRHVAFSHAEEGVPVSRMLPPERDEKYYQNL
ncbi:hypothetical protein BC829DRAFT_391006 [Chytridium lagenaria]|nr:hypothetical protein BC829DRAFT_391006 [Chytridium lagenaria]